MLYRDYITKLAAGAIDASSAAAINKLPAYQQQMFRTRWWQRPFTKRKNVINPPEMSAADKQSGAFFSDIPGFERTFNTKKGTVTKTLPVTLSSLADVGNIGDMDKVIQNMSANHAAYYLQNGRNLDKMLTDSQRQTLLNKAQGASEAVRSGAATAGAAEAPKDMYSTMMMYQMLGSGVNGIFQTLQQNRMLESQERMQKMMTEPLYNYAEDI